MGFLSNLNKISKEIKGGYVSGQMSGAIKYTLFESKAIPDGSSKSSNHDGENYYFDKHDSFIIREVANQEIEKFKILEKINVDQESVPNGVIIKTLKGSDIYSFMMQFAIPGVFKFMKVTSSDPTWEPFEGQVTQVMNAH